LTCVAYSATLFWSIGLLRVTVLFLQRGIMLLLVGTLHDVSVAWKLCYKGLNMILKESILMLTRDFVRSGGITFDQRPVAFATGIHPNWSMLVR
jgi:hypothetical protein